MEVSILYKHISVQKQLQGKWLALLLGSYFMMNILTLVGFPSQNVIRKIPRGTFQVWFKKKDKKKRQVKLPYF